MKRILLLLTLVSAAFAQNTITVATNIPITQPFDSPVVTLTGSLLNARVFMNIHVPASTSILFTAETSADGVVWSGLGGATIFMNNPAVPKLTDFGVDFVLPGALGWKVRIRVVSISGPCTLNSISVVN